MIPRYHPMESRLNIGALDLPNVDGRVNASSDIHQYVRPNYFCVPREAIHLDLARSNSLSAIRSGEKAIT